MNTQADQTGRGTIGIGFMNFTSTVSLGDPDSSFMSIKTRFQTYAESIHRILQTAPLDRPHEVNIGCILRRLLFDPNDFYLQRAADYAVRSAITQQEPRLEILSMSIEVFANDKRLRIRLIFAERASQAKFALDEELQL